MPAPFIHSLCGYRGTNGNPNTSDNHDKLSVRLGQALFERLGIPDDQIGPENPGGAMEKAVRSHLTSIRPDLAIEQSRPAFAFAQYSHLAVFRDFRRNHVGALNSLSTLESMIDEISDAMARDPLRRELRRAKDASDEQDRQIAKLKSQMPEESLLNIDVTVAEVSRTDVNPRLHVALSAKWSLRTDRAQDCVSQGSKLVMQRRGRMPHFAVVTMEPRPSMLKILGDGSGSVDCVYHLDLSSLRQALKDLQALRMSSSSSWSPAHTLDRLVDQGRVRDYDELVTEVSRQPANI